MMIREAVKEDVKNIQRLMTILENQTYEPVFFQNRFYQHIENELYLYYVYVIDEQIVGFISLFIKEPLHHIGKTGEILELCVDPDYRNQNIGAKLLYHVEEYAKANHFEEIELSSHMRRKDAHRFYEKNYYQKDHFNFTKKLK